MFRIEQITVTKAEVASVYGVTTRTVTNWMRARRISFLKVGRLVRFDLGRVKADLERSGLVKAQ